MHGQQNISWKPFKKIPKYRVDILIPNLLYLDTYYFLLAALSTAVYNVTINYAPEHQQVQTELFLEQPTYMEPASSYKRSKTNIPEDLNVHQQYCEELCMMNILVYSANFSSVFSVQLSCI